MRKSIVIIVSIALLLGSFLLAKFLIDSKKTPKQKDGKLVKTVFVKEVLNSNIPITITANGTLIAKNKIELFSEVQGILEITTKEFRTGTKYNRNEVLIKINSDEFLANLKAQKSNFINVLTAVLPDIKLDFPSEYTKWQDFLNNISINKPLPKLPIPNSEKENYFVTGRGILTNYYAVKNLEVKLAKYSLVAPFNGIVTEALVTPGTLIRPGQKLGEFINPTTFEMAISIKSEFKDLLQINKTVTLNNLEKTKSWVGKVVRLNGKVDSATQTIKAFIEVSGSDLKEGQYLEVAVQAKEEQNAIEIPRNILVENSKLFVVTDSVLSLIPIKLVYENNETVVVKGIENGTKIITKPVPGAYTGMLVKIASSKE